MTTFKINNIDVTDIIAPPLIELTPRSQSVKYMLDGSTAIDRIGGLKYSISITFPLITQTRWNPLIDIFSEMSFPVSFSHNGFVRNRTFRLDGSIPSPLALYNGSTYYYNGISVKLEEM